VHICCRCRDLPLGNPNAAYKPPVEAPLVRDYPQQTVAIIFSGVYNR
jgi:hypothetical protein